MGHVRFNAVASCGRMNPERKLHGQPSDRNREYCRAIPGPAPDLVAIKTKQQAAWSSGDYAIVGSTLQIVGEELCEAMDLKAGSKVLDVAAGNGMASLAAARRWCDVTSTDYVPALLERGRARAAAEGLRIDIQGSGRGKPAVRQQQLRRGAVDLRRDVHAEPGQGRRRAAARVPAEGTIGLANWTPEGFIGQVFKTLGKYLPPPAGAKSPALWGTRARLAEMFDADAASIESRGSRHSISAIARPIISSMCSRPSMARC